jgi:Zn-finger nucleic acid-binding protein
VPDHPEVDLTPRINCPVCSSTLDRFVFCLDSGVTIDRCAEHGMWLDDGELARVLNYLKQSAEHSMDSFPTEPAARQLGFLAGLRRFLSRT